jgi:hypothetical protein
MGLRDRLGSLKQRAKGALPSQSTPDREAVEAAARARARRAARQLGDVGVEPADAAGTTQPDTSAEATAARAAHASTVRGPIDASPSPLTARSRDTVEAMVTGGGRGLGDDLVTGGAGGGVPGIDPVGGPDATGTSVGSNADLAPGLSVASGSGGDGAVTGGTSSGFDLTTDMGSGGGDDGDLPDLLGGDG